MTFALLIILVITGCGGNNSNNNLQVLLPTEPVATEVTIIEPTPTNTIVTTPENTATPTLEPTMTPTPLPEWSMYSGGNIEAPILLYHHISLDSSGFSGNYYMPPESFEEQMRALAAMGYETVTADYLVDAIWHGGLMPDKPIVITFDDGQLSVYKNAYPIMKELGFVGTIYYVPSWYGTDTGMNDAEIAELLAAGWTIGSHGYSHINMTTIEAHLDAHHEMRESKLRLEELFNTEVNTFAYPFGAMDEYIGGKTSDYGYTGAMGLGTSRWQGLFNVYYMSRIEISGFQTLDGFIGQITN